MANTEKKMRRINRRAYASVFHYGTEVLRFAVHVMANRPYFEGVLTEQEETEFRKLLNLTTKLSQRYKSLAWKLEGFDPVTGPPSPADARIEKARRRRKQRRASK